MSQTLSVSPGKYILKQATENKDNVIKKSNMYYYKKKHHNTCQTQNLHVKLYTCKLLHL